MANADNENSGRRQATARSADAPTEMEVVDAFTRLILGDPGRSVLDEEVLAALCAVDANLRCSSTGAADTTRVGAYLRALGVREMIRLVQRVRDYCRSGIPPLSPLAGTEALASADRPATR